MAKADDVRFAVVGGALTVRPGYFPSSLARYKIDIEKDPSRKVLSLRSMYAEDEADCLKFQYANDELDLLETPFAMENTDKVRR